MYTTNLWSPQIWFTLKTSCRRFLKRTNDRYSKKSLCLQVQNEPASFDPTVRHESLYNSQRISSRCTHIFLKRPSFVEIKETPNRPAFTFASSFSTRSLGKMQGKKIYKTLVRFVISTRIILGVSHFTLSWRLRPEIKFSIDRERELFSIRNHFFIRPKTINYSMKHPPSVITNQSIRLPAH